MSKKSSAALPSVFETLTVAQLREAWPKDASGRRAAILMQRYLFSVSLHAARDSECKDRAQAEAGANKIMAALLADVGTIVFVEEAKEKPVLKMRRLHSMGGDPSPQTDKTSSPPKTQ